MQNEKILEFGCDIKISADRCLACAVYVLAENESQGNTKMNLVDLREKIKSMAPECINHFTDILKYSKIYYDKETMNASLAKTYNVEYEIVETISNVLKGDQDKWDFDITKYKNVNGNILSDEQMSTLINVCNNNFVILNGAAGCGKSMSVRALINMLEDNRKDYILMTPTGKSAKVLADFTDRRASTIHRGLGYTPEGWTYNKDNKLLYDIVIIDEFSMVDVFLFKRVIDAIDFNKTKLLLIGDNAQLPSVQCGNLLHDFMSSKLIPTTTLTKVFRYAEGGLMKVATDTRYCNPYLNKEMKNKVTTFGRDYTFIDVPAEKITSNVLALYKKLLTMGYTIEDIQVLSAKKKGECGTIQLNNMIQKIANKNYGSDNFIQIGETTYHKGDVVIQNENNYEAKIATDYLGNDQFSVDDTAFVANGETGIIEKIESSSIIINFDGICVRYTKEDILKIGLGYAITIHKSQGSSIKVVIVCTPRSHAFMLNSNLIYVALTRMKERCFHFGEIANVNSAISKKANTTRHTWTQNLLISSFT